MFENFVVIVAEAGPHAAATWLTASLAVNVVTLVALALQLLCAAWWRWRG